MTAYDGLMQQRDSDPGAMLADKGYDSDTIRVCPQGLGILSSNAGPGARADRLDPIGVVDQEIPRLFAGGNNGFITVPHQQAQFVGPQVVPRVLHCIEFR